MDQRIRENFINRNPWFHEIKTKWMKFKDKASLEEIYRFKKEEQSESKTTIYLKKQKSIISIKKNKVDQIQR